MEEYPAAPKTPKKTVKIGNKIEEMVYRHTYHKEDGTMVVREIYERKKAPKLQAVTVASSRASSRTRLIKKVEELGKALKISAYFADKIIRLLKRNKAKLQRGRTPLDVDRFKLNNFSCNIFNYLCESELMTLIIKKKDELKLTDEEERWFKGALNRANCFINREIERAKTVRELTEEQIKDMISKGIDPNAD